MAGSLVLLYMCKCHKCVKSSRRGSVQVPSLNKLAYCTDNSQRILHVDSVPGAWDFNHRCAAITALADPRVHLTGDGFELAVIFAHDDLEWHFAVLQILPQWSVCKKRKQKNSALENVCACNNNCGDWRRKFDPEQVWKFWAKISHGWCDQVAI